MTTLTAPQNRAPHADWFARSKVADKEGHPLLVYHGTSAEPFDRFDCEDIYCTEEGDILTCQINYFTDDPVVAQSFADAREGPGRVIAAYLSFQDPLEIDAKGKMASQLPPMAAVGPARSMRHDGVIIRNLRDGNLPASGPPATIFIALDPKSIWIASQSHFSAPPPMDRKTMLSECRRYSQLLADRLAAFIWREPKPGNRMKLMEVLATIAKEAGLIGNPMRLSRDSEKDFAANMLVNNPLAAMWMSKRFLGMRFEPWTYEDILELTDDLFPHGSARIAALNPRRSTSLVPSWYRSSWRHVEASGVHT